MKRTWLLLPIAIAVWASAAAQQSESVLATHLTPGERAVWAQEEAYWRFVKTQDRPHYYDLWDDGFVGWPRFEPAPVHKDHIGLFMSERKVIEYKLEPLSVKEYGRKVVITIYRSIVRSTDASGSNENTHTARLTHTWMKTKAGWRIIGGMSAEDKTSAISPNQ